MIDLLAAWILAASIARSVDWVPLLPSRPEPPVIEAPAPEALIVETGEPVRVACGDRIRDLYGEQHAIRYFLLDVPTGVDSIQIRLAEGSGDADLYLRRGREPTLDRFDARPFVDGNREDILIADPLPGEWYIMVHGYRRYTGAVMTIACHVQERDTAANDLRSPRDLELALYYELSGGAAREQAWSAELRNQALRDEGRIAFNNGDYKAAIDVWTRWSKIDPENPEPVSLIGDIHLRRGDITAAVAQYRRSLQIQPGQIGLMVRMARIMDIDAGQSMEARALLNFYARLFPNHPDVALAQAEWLLRRKRYDEAGVLIGSVIDSDWDNLRARTLLHGLLRTPEERFVNMQAMIAIGDRPGLEASLAQAITDNNLMTRPESWMLMNFIERMAFEAPIPSLREFCLRLLPRDVVAVEDFRVGRMSRNWISSREQIWDEDGNLVVSADVTQSEAFLRLSGSDSMHNGFIEATIDNARGFFWLYARRGEGNMIRFGFDETGLMYQQVWMGGQLRMHESRLWSKPPGPVRLRLEVRADGAYTYVNNRSAFGSPLSIPRDMGLGWWGLAPWSPELGTAAVTVRRVAGGPNPVRLVLAESPALLRRDVRELDRIQSVIRTASMLAPDWYLHLGDGRIVRKPGARDQELRLLSRYHRTRLMPLLQTRGLHGIDWDRLGRLAARDRLDGFTIKVDKMPDPDWIMAMEARLVSLGYGLNLVLIEPDGRQALFRELVPFVGLFPGARRAHALPVYEAGFDGLPALPAAGGALIRL